MIQGSLGDFTGYLEGEAVDRFLKAYGIRFAAGSWCAGNFVDRFATRGYTPDLDPSLPAQIARVRAAGIDGVEFHDMDFFHPDLSRKEDVIRDAKEALVAHRVSPTNMNFNTWTDPKWRFGAVTNPDAGLRRAATDQILAGVDLAAEMGFASAGYWPGSDGWDYHFEVDYGQRMRWFIDACVEIASRCREKGLPFGTEPKQKEPREMNMITNTVAKAALVCLEVNRTLGETVMGVAIDYGHEQMCGNTPAESLYTLREFGLPIANFHLNGAKYNSNDEDRIAGTDDIWRMVEFCYAAIDTGYSGWFGLDQFTYRTDQVRSMALSREFFANCFVRALRIHADRPKLVAAQATGDAANTIDVVKRHVYGG